jgi:hypothetical protein
VPFLRYTRDKRGYETTYVMHGYRTANGPSRTRVLYLFRSPAHVRIGRQALDEEAREALTHTHPDLTFDWHALDREAVVSRYEPPVHSKPRRPPGRPGAAAPPPAVLDDSVLGRALGAGEAARLRTEYAALLDRITRRARTPEDRDRLLERAHRLNPDEWPDAAAVAAGRRTLDAEWGALRAELPSRRRGRRGSRPGDDEAADGQLAGSGIMANEEEDHHARPSDREEAAADRPDGHRGSAADLGAELPDGGPADDVPGDE